MLKLTLGLMFYLALFLGLWTASQPTLAPKGDFVWSINI